MFLKTEGKKVNTEVTFFKVLTEINFNFKDKPLSEFCYHDIQHIELIYIILMFPK